jgi:GDPmannose 4,6-dehydratase
MKRALIIGVSGQDGAYLAQLLINKDYIVYGTSRDAELSTFSNLLKLGVINQVEKESVSPTDFRSVFQVLTKTQPDEIYNLSGQSSVGLSFLQPVETLESIGLGTLNILEAIRMSGLSTRFYNAASGECFGASLNGQEADEQTPFRPRSPYAVAKASAFWEVANYREAYELFACSGILFNHESPLRPERFVSQKIVHAAIQIASGNQRILKLGDLSIQRDWGWAPDYVEAMWLMLQQPKPEDYVVATGETHTLEEFVSAAFDRVGLDWHDHVKSDQSLFRPTEVSVSRANPSKARHQLGWTAGYKMIDVVHAMIDRAKESL